MIGIVIPHFNHREYLETCIPSLLKQSYKDFHIILVDNGSTDDSVEYVGKKFPQVEILQHKSNLGFTGGVNKGIEYCKENNYEYVALFNNDAVASENWLEELFSKISEDNLIGAVTSKFLIEGTNTIDSTGDFYSLFGFGYPRGRGIKDENQYDELPNITSVSGGASIYRMSALENITNNFEISAFDDKFFAYYEDVEMSLRLIQAGYTLIYSPEAIAYHKLGGTSGGHISEFTRYHATKNSLFLYFQVMPSPLILRYGYKLVIGQFLWLVNSIRHKVLIANLRGYLTFIASIPKVIKKRRAVARNMEITNSEFLLSLNKKLSPQQIENLENFKSKIISKLKRS